MRLECGCPATFPDWDGVDIDLSGQPAHILPIPTFLHMPLSFETYLNRQWKDIKRFELTEKWPGLVLTQTGFFRGRIIAMLENGESPSRYVQSLPLSFQLHARLHKGDMGTIRESIRRLQSSLIDAARMPKELYLCYLTCPRCRASRGGDKILLLRRWVESERLKRRQ
jgi:hypothetical protein